MSIEIKADLHNHTTYSDGKYSVYEVIKRAEEKNISVIAITDHDNLDSYVDVKFINTNILVLVGVELSTWYNHENVHILGYFYENTNPGGELVLYLDELKKKRITRAKEIIKKLKEYYDIDVSFDDIPKENLNVVARPQIARLIASKYNMSVNEAFEKYLNSDSKAYVPSNNISTRDAIDLLHRNNAIAVWAHPILNKNKFNEEDIIKMGIDGIEGSYPKNTKDDTKHYRDLANRYDLLFTGGSDFHDDESHSEIGTSYITNEDIDKFLDKLNIKKIG